MARRLRCRVAGVNFRWDGAEALGAGDCVKARSGVPRSHSDSGKRQARKRFREGDLAAIRQGGPPSALPEAMKGLFARSGHLVRPGLVIIAALVVFLAVRGALVPADFGKYGHYRAGALTDIRNLPISYAGQDLCVACHADQASARAEGKHAHVSCEACHGPQATHAYSDDHAASKPALPDAAVLCKRCHEADAAKPKWFPQVKTAEHSLGLVCTTCHKPHAPKI